MAVALWSGRRLGMVWVFGSVLEIAILAGSVFTHAQSGVPNARRSRTEARITSIVAVAPQNAIELRPRAQPDSETSRHAEERMQEMRSRTEAIGENLSVSMQPMQEFSINNALYSASGALALFGTIPFVLIVITRKWYRSAHLRARQQA